jgi:hypothetical protein
VGGRYRGRAEHAGTTGAGSVQPDGGQVASGSDLAAVSPSWPCWPIWPARGAAGRTPRGRVRRRRSGFLIAAVLLVDQQILYVRG